MVDNVLWKWYSLSMKKESASKTKEAPLKIFLAHTLFILMTTKFPQIFHFRIVSFYVYSFSFMLYLLFLVKKSPRQNIVQNIKKVPDNLLVDSHFSASTLLVCHFIIAHHLTISMAVLSSTFSTFALQLLTFFVSVNEIDLFINERIHSFLDFGFNIIYIWLTEI